MTEPKAETETFEIRSKSFTVKWINIPQNSNIKWKIRPLKNSINLGIYQQKKSNNNSNNNSNESNNETPSTSNLENLNFDQVNELPHRFFNNISNKNKLEDSLTRSSSQSIHSMGHSINNSISSINNNINSSSISLEEKLDKQLTKVQWIGKCNGDSLKMGNIKTSKGGLYAFVFDNTFSKTKAKTVLFQFDIKNLEDDLKKDKQIKSTEKNISNEVNDKISNNNGHNHLKTQFESNLNGSSAKIINFKGVQYLEGYLMKKKRRNNSAKNFTKRFFSLNLTYSILYYYSDSDSNIIRGNMMITQTVVSADSLELLLYLDSGMEQWILKATSKKDFDIWVSAFNFVKNQSKKIKDSSIKSPSLSRNNTINFNENNSNFSDDLNELNNDFNSQYHIVQDKIDSLKDTINSYIQSNNDFEENNDNKVTPLIQQGIFSEQSNSEPRSSPQEISVPSSSSVSVQSNSQTPIDSLKKVRKSSTSSIIESTNININNNNSNNSNNSMPSRKPSFLHRLKRKGSQSLPSTPETQTFDLETPLTSRTKNRTISTESYSSANANHSQSQSLSSIPCSPLIESISNDLISNKILSNRILNSILEKVNDLENEYLELLKQEKIGLKSESRISLNYTRSILSQEFYDAQEFADETEQGVVMLNEYESNGVIDTAKELKDDELNSEIFGNQLKETKTIISSSSSSSIIESDQEVENNEDVKHIVKNETNESKIIDLYPLPYNGKYHFRSDIKPAACEPPSLISILRKGIGKDLTSMTMPISTNEPLSFLQKYTESLEYCSLINDAMSSPIETGERILKISTFAISFLSSYADKIRSIRKPFNPLLGETFELVRPDLDIRILTEKVIHKPFVMAAHVDSTNWYIEHSICPQQKFYGKTAEISVDGTLKLKFRENDEIYEWNQPNTILRNIVSLTGEKYTEPIDSIVIKSNTGYKCIVNFISENGRFTSSRSEKVELKVYGDKNDKTPLSLSAKGSWTKDISMSNGKLIWKISESLPHHEKKYGFTKFSCCLNDLDEIHKPCAPTDSRRRPDQRMYENGIIDDADELKLKLEENQRLRRKDANGNEVTHKPAFFEKGNTDLDWTFIHGKKGYWNRRKAGDWDDLVKLW